VFARLLDVDLADLSVGGLVRLARVGKGQTTWAARRKHLNMIRWKRGGAVGVATDGVGGDLVGAF